MELSKVGTEGMDEIAIVKAADILRSGGTIIYPTETLYALGANALSMDAVKKVFRIKGRNWNKPISVAVDSLKKAEKYFEFNDVARRIAESFLPGPLTIILSSKALPTELSTTGKFSFRIPDNRIALSILEKVDFPVTATSANISGGSDTVDAKSAVEQIGSKVDLVLDGGKCKYSSPSTVVDLSYGKLIVVREGVISKEELLKFC